MSQITLEICCASLADTVAAESGGADRVELCSAMFLGGLTPSIATLALVKEKTRIPVMAMVRPRAGGFCYSSLEFEVMEREAELLLAQGADGIVFGILDADRTVDLERCRRLRDRIGDREGVFHRAFDVVPDPLRALDELIELGFIRVLTSGQRQTAMEGATLIRRLVDHARGRIEILPGGGIRPQNVGELLSRTGCSHVHATAFRQHEDPSTAGSDMKFGSGLNPSDSSYDLTDSRLVRHLRETLDAL